MDITGGRVCGRGSFANLSSFRIPLADARVTAWQRLREQPWTTAFLIPERHKRQIKIVRRTIDHATSRKRVGKTWPTSARTFCFVFDRGANYFPTAITRSFFAELLLLEINHLSGLKTWPVSLLIIPENLETFENVPHRRSSYPTNLEGIIKRNGIIKQ